MAREVRTRWEGGFTEQDNFDWPVFLLTLPSKGDKQKKEKAKRRKGIRRSVGPTPPVISLFDVPSPVLETSKR